MRRMTVIVKELILGIVSLVPDVIRALRRKGSKKKPEAEKAKGGGEGALNAAEGGGEGGK